MDAAITSIPYLDEEDEDRLEGKRCIEANGETENLTGAPRQLCVAPPTGGGAAASTTTV
ncbi:MAG TPA: hypothetical protein VKV29_12410 [Chthonomonas sp.]|uniref:hypothetical protein n=1 Tax=Chthonomonas sp. TaxID=2282153 RepID=UPI002B4AEBB5|nr:hypothetical protein [Chthonomonas sp.]HLH81069.1 hypothetical protein [Chthonomonas sp.]